MAGGGRMGGQGNLLQRGIWVFVACCIVVAVWNTFPHDPKGFYRELGHKSQELKGVAGKVVDWLPLDRFGGDGGSGKKDGSSEKPRHGRGGHDSNGAKGSGSGR